MKKQETDRIHQLRVQGVPPSVIARELGLSINTIKSFIRRNPNISGTLECRWCGVPVIQSPGRKQKRFCSDRCRITYWNHRYRGEEQHGRDKAS